MLIYFHFETCEENTIPLSTTTLLLSRKKSYAVTSSLTQVNFIHIQHYFEFQCGRNIVVLQQSMAMLERAKASSSSKAELKNEVIQT